MTSWLEFFVLFLSTVYNKFITKVFLRHHPYSVNAKKLILRLPLPMGFMLVRNDENRRFIRIVDFGLIAIHDFAEQLLSVDKEQVKFMAPEVNSKIWHKSRYL